MKVEYLVAHNNHYWNTKTVEVPLDTQDREQLVQWAENNLAGQEQYRTAVLFAVYHIPQEQPPGVTNGH